MCTVAASHTREVGKQRKQGACRMRRCASLARMAAAATRRAPASGRTGAELRVLERGEEERHPADAQVAVAVTRAVRRVHLHMRRGGARLNFLKRGGWLGAWGRWAWLGIARRWDAVFINTCERGGEGVGWAGSAHTCGSVNMSPTPCAAGAKGPGPRIRGRGSGAAYERRVSGALQADSSAPISAHSAPARPRPSAGRARRRM